MIIEDTFILLAPVKDVWDFLLDVETMSQCIPGVDALEALDDKTYRGQLKIKIGPITAAFRGVVTFKELDPPNRLVAVIEADDKASASKIKATFTATLTPHEGGTQVAYQTDLNLRGRLAQFGSAVVRGTAKKMTAQFGKCVQQSLDEGGST